MQLIPVLNISKAPMASNTPRVEFVVERNRRRMAFSDCSVDDLDRFQMFDQFGCWLIERSLVRDPLSILPFAVDCELDFSRIFWHVRVEFWFVFVMEILGVGIKLP